MRPYGTFNESRTAASDMMFFAIQTAISSYPGDPRRKEFQEIVDKISSTTDLTLQSKYAAAGCAMAAESIPFTDYCVWDYSLVSNVAKTEFSSWIDGIQENINTSKEENIDSPFVTEDTSYIVVTFAMLSTHSSLQNWLNYLEYASAKKFFARQSIEHLWERIGKSNANMLNHSVNALFAITPRHEDRWYTGAKLRSDDWKYLKPVY
jgi:hypothetical protein